MTDVERPRRRVRAAQSALDRVHREQARFLTAYGAASSAQQRFNAAATALRSAAAHGRHQPAPDEVARRLDQLTNHIVGLLDELFEAQQAHANQIIRADKRRIARRERRRNRDRRTHPQPERPAGAAAA